MKSCVHLFNHARLAQIPVLVRLPRKVPEVQDSDTPSELVATGLHTTLIQRQVEIAAGS